MAEKYGFFNSNNGDRKYDAQDIANFLKKFFTNGVFNNSLEVIANDNMTITLKTGSANINGYSYELTADKDFDISDADTALSRIDSVILRLDLNNRNISSMIISGDYATNPTAPNIVKTENIYDLRLANISVPANALRISSDMITDTRFTSDCGNVTQTVLSLDTEDIFKQYETAFYNWFNQVKTDLTGDVAGNLSNDIIELRTLINNSNKTLGLDKDTYSNTATYSKGDIVVKNHMLYEAQQDIVAAEEWTEAHWTLTPLIEQSN